MNINIKFSKFFSYVQEAPWYRSFLNPLIALIDYSSSLLDVGTGSGKMLEILSKEKKVRCIGIDTNEDMLKEAKEKLRTTNTKLIQVEANKSFPFTENSFDYVTICNVLFHLKDKEINIILEEAFRVVKPNGKIIILTPTGDRNNLILSGKYFSLKNLSIYIWFNATKKRASLWSKKKYLKSYAGKNNYRYSLEIIMGGFAQLEILNK